MSVSALPGWKQLLLERKRREEEEREKREREEEERLASIPAWKRGIIQRRRAKQEGGGEKEREKVRAAGLEFEPETLSVEPIWKNYFSCSKNCLAKEQRRKEMERGGNDRKKQRESTYERMSGEKYSEKEESRGRREDRGIQMEGTRKRDIIGDVKERESDERERKVGERDVHSPLISAIHAIKAENIIIIENRKYQREKREGDGERESEEGKKQGMNMDLKEFLAGGERVTEICVSEVLIIKPSEEERSKEDRKRGNEEEKKTTLGAVEKEGKETECRSVSQLISKFGENCKRPCRSKSSDCFITTEMWGEVRQEERKERERKDECRTGGRVNAFRGVPKRSFSFSEQVCKERRVLERSYSDRRKREIEGEVEKEEKREKRTENVKKGVTETDRNSEISTCNGETKRFKEENKQERMMKKDKTGGETEKEMEEIQRERNDREQQTEFQNESLKIVKHGQVLIPVSQSRVKFSDGEAESQRYREERGMSRTWNEAVQHREEILIPRSVFYGISKQSFSRDEIRRVERRWSWKAGRPLTRVESLRERIWQKERTDGGDERTKEAEMESRQEVASPQSLSPFDVTKEVSKEELPVNVPPSLSAVQEPSIFTYRHDGVIRAPEREKTQEEDLLGEDYIPPSPSSSTSSSPSPPLRHTQPAMSRIYNLKPVTSRAGVCITERNLDVQAHSGGMIKIRPGPVPGPSKVQTEISSLRSVQLQVEQLHLKEPEVWRQNDREASQKQNVLQTSQDQNIDMQKSQTHTIAKLSSESRVQIQLPQISTSTTKSINTQIEPAVTSKPLFTIRSASGGPGKRGTTITITPRKSGASGTPSSSITAPKVSSSSITAPKVSSSSITAPKVSSSSITTPKAPSNTPELCKKRYPTAEEIEVIGGYKNLEKSCLVKNRESPKTVRVRFAESQLECVCTYPSEGSVVGEEGSGDDWRKTEEKKDEEEEEEDEDGVTGAGREMNRVLRVDESSRR